MSDKSLLKPTVMNTITKIIDHLYSQGLDKNDIIILVQERTKPRMNKGEVKTVIDALLLFDKQIAKSIPTCNDCGLKDHFNIPIYNYEETEIQYHLCINCFNKEKEKK